MEVSGAVTLNSAAQQFIDSVLRLQPRVAAFDCDGTLWSGDAGVAFFDWEIERGVVSAEVARTMRSRYAEYKAGKVSEDDMCGEMVSMHEGITEAVMQQVASDFIETAFPGGVFAEMRELVRRLHENGSEVWAVSSSSEWVIQAGMKQFGIPNERILATKVEVADGIITSRMVRIPSGPGKTRALREVAKKPIDAAFGNSRWDVDMLSIAKHPFAVNPNPDLEAVARQKGWPVYFPESRTEP
jgi:HAD superfamily phosphoserine phosphatase-like hydrolase